MNALLLNKQIDLVDFDGLKLFMLEDNLYRTVVPDARKRQDLDAYQRTFLANGAPTAPVNPANVHQVASSRFGTFIVMHHLWQHGIDFVVLDIGSHIGDFGLRVANFVRTFGKNTKVVSFDPSEAGALVPYSIELNQLEAVIKHEMLAVSDLDGFALFQHRSGFAEGAEIIGARKSATALLSTWLERFRQLPIKRRIAAYFALGLEALKRLSRLGRVVDSQTLLVRSVDVLGYLARNGHTGDVFAKIDIEGHDPFVINRLLNLLPERKLYIIFEFTPSRYASPEAAAAYLEKLSADFHVFDLFYCPNPTRFKLIAPNQLTALADDVGQRPQGYTDVFLLDKRTPDCQLLLQRLAALANEADVTIL